MLFVAPMIKFGDVDLLTQNNCVVTRKYTTDNSNNVTILVLLKWIKLQLIDARLLSFLPEGSKSHFLAHRGVVYILNEARHYNRLIGENFSLNFYHCEGFFDFC